ncbi:MAG: AmmeMemoRadiSam system radical SAM enzyme [Candidatus Bathyarchaeota archaeon]|nr:AmmeMemoRadiSam system radical SAM enzyme [Candidatus Bathyarchaeota archaeon]
MKGYASGQPLINRRFPNSLRSMESRFVEKLREDTLRCTICPRMCVIQPGKRGFCGTKENQNGKLVSLTYGHISALAVDPIEKKPLAHFYPGSRALSISSVGCSFTCPWCQNYHISTGNIENHQTRYMHPEEVVEIAMTQECTSIAYTYNEPLINLNYVEDTARFAHESDVKNVLVTNGYISTHALEKVVDVIDAANVDWKAFNNEFYKEHCSADLQSVLDSTEYMKEHGVHVETTFLVIPETNDSEREIREMVKYIIGHLGPDTPLHLSRFFPMYKFQHLSPTPVETLIRAREIALEEGLRYVFVGNVRSGGYEDTVCPECGKPVIDRTGYTITGWNLDEDMNCRNCGYHVSIVGRKETHSDGFLV